VSGTVTPRYFQNATGSGDWTFSVYAKAAEADCIFVSVYTGTTYKHLYYDLTNQSVISLTASSYSVNSVGNGWFRVSVTETTTVPYGNISFGLANATLGNTGANFTSDGTSGLYVWGAQLEENPYATSYIPTYGSTATRAADVSSSSSNTFGNSFYNQTEGSIYVQSTNFGNPSDTTLFCLDDGTTGQQNQIDTRLSAGIDYRVRVRSNAVSVSDIDPGPSFALGDSVKLAQVYKVNDYAASQNGLTAVTDTSGAMPLTSQTNLKLNKRGSGNTVGHTCFERITYWQTRLSNDTLKTITA